MKNYNKVKKTFLLIEDTYSKYATKSSDAIRYKEIEEDIRPAFFRDSDRILHSLSYTRYSDKTQVYSYKHNDHISKRMTHVQLVSKVARTIGRGLGLNTDLIEAIALGHDIGHTPLGHTGEAILNEISMRELGEYFAHNIQGFREYMYVEKQGRGLNLTVQVLDGIMCHNGEMVSNTYAPTKKTPEEVLAQYNLAYKDLKQSNKISPMTLEGCVVRISDIVAYIGRDIEDSINLGLIKRSILPESITKILGNDNKDIINVIVTDIIDNSLDKPYITMSKEVFTALKELKDFNYKNIYSKSLTKKEIEFYRKGMNKIYKKYLDDIKNKNKQSSIYKMFLKGQDKDYLETTPIERQVIDFIAGMTDEMFLKEIKK